MRKIRLFYPEVLSLNLNSKLDKSGKAAPFEYFGKLQYISHNGECPISFKFKYLEA